MVNPKFFQQRFKWERGHKDDSNDTLQLLCECDFQARFPVTLHLDEPGLALIQTKGKQVRLKLKYRLWGIIGIILMSHFSWRDRNLIGFLSLTLIIEWRIVPSNVHSFQVLHMSKPTLKKWAYWMMQKRR